jgi:hypothetical protein
MHQLVRRIMAKTIAYIIDQTIGAIKNARSRFLPAWYLPNGTMNAAENELEKASSSCERWSIWFSWLVIVSIVADLIIAFVEPPYPSFLKLSVPSDFGVAIGIVGEVMLGMRNNRIQTELRNRSNSRLGEAEERASSADLKRAELEARLQPRETDQRQFDLIQTLRGKVVEISIIHERGLKARWFANSLRDAFFIAGIRVGEYMLGVENPTAGIFIYDPAMREAKASDVCETLVDLFRGTQTPVAMLTGLPIGVSGVPTEYPAIVIGEMAEVLPPHMAKAMQMADATYAEMKRRGLL